MTTPTNLDSTNWSGAVISGASGSFSSISAEWVVPTVSQVPGQTTSDVAEWVGIDGYNSSDVCQAGILQTVQTSGGHTTITTSAFDEWYPAAANMIPASSLQVSPGNTIQITVDAISPTKAQFIFDDVSTGKTLDTSLTAPRGTSLQGNSAEVVVETPELISGNRVTQPLLADFLSTPVTFNDIDLNGGLANLSSFQTISVWSDDVPGSYGTYVQEAYGSVNDGSVNAASDSVTVTENDYWPNSSSDGSTLFGYDRYF